MTIRRRTLRHVASWEAPDQHQSKALSWSRSDGWSSSRDNHDRTAGGGLASWSQRTGSVNRDRSSNWSPSDGLEASWKNSTIAVRSNRDRGAIKPRSGSLRDAIASNRSENDQRLTRTSIFARSWPDRGPIVARSWVFLRQKSWPFRSEIEAKLWLISSQSGSYVLAKWNCLHDAWIPPPRPHQLPTIFGPISLFKSMYFPLLFFNFWSTREEIKRVSRKVLSSRDPLLPSV